MLALMLMAYDAYYDTLAFRRYRFLRSQVPRLPPFAGAEGRSLSA